MARDKEYIKLIHSRRWQNLRFKILSMHPLCERCQAKGKITAACEVHHIRPVEEAFTHNERINRMYDPNNLMALCHDCHVQAHVEMGRSGKVATQKRNKKQVDEVMKKLFGIDKDD